jgi:hypothetical protein
MQVARREGTLQHDKTLDIKPIIFSFDTDEDDLMLVVGSCPARSVNAKLISSYSGGVCTTRIIEVEHDNYAIHAKLEKVTIGQGKTSLRIC